MTCLPTPTEILEYRLAWVSRNILRVNDFAHGHYFQEQISDVIEYVRDSIRKTLDEHGTCDVDLGDDTDSDDDTWIVGEDDPERDDHSW